MKRGVEEVEPAEVSEIPNKLRTYIATEAHNVTCSIPPGCVARPRHFNSYRDFETHYFRYHGFSCAECKLTFPNEHILGLHITEIHDSFAMARKSRGDKIYGCFVESCDRLCSSPWKRRRHAIDKHMYPREYFFEVVKYGMRPGQTTLLNQTRHRGGPEVPDDAKMKEPESQ